MMVRKTKIIIIAVLVGVLCTSCGIPSTITQTASASEPALLLEDNFDDHYQWMGSKLAGGT